MDCSFRSPDSCDHQASVVIDSPTNYHCGDYAGRAVTWGNDICYKHSMVVRHITVALIKHYNLHMDYAPLMHSLDNRQVS
jgi:hypothetical protein